MVNQKETIEEILGEFSLNSPSGAYRIKYDSDFVIETYDFKEVKRFKTLPAAIRWVRKK